jgi:hypothetical protein
LFAYSQFNRYEKERAMECGHCRFYQTSESECHRYAPSPAEGDKKAYWPTVAFDDWCGEYMPREEQRQVA